jgi:hypothetical protein
MKARTIPLAALARVLVPLSSARADAGVGIEGRLDILGTPYTMQLRVETANGLHMRGRVGAGDAQYDLKLHIDKGGVLLDGRPQGEPRPRRSPQVEEL